MQKILRYAIVLLVMVACSPIVKADPKGLDQFLKAIRQVETGGITGNLLALIRFKKPIGLILA